jgi:hypothetical protein
VRRAIPVIILLLTSIFSAAVGAIRAQADDSEHIRTFMTAGCAGQTEPCWGGIVPGSTTASRALSLLQAHPWVAEAVFEETRWAGYISWAWAPDAPGWLRDADRLDIQPGLWVTNGVVSYLTVPTYLAYGAYEHALGAPEHGIMQVVSRDLAMQTAALAVSGTVREITNAYFLAAYDDSQLVIETHFNCPAPARAFWSAPVTVSLFSDSLMQGVPFDDYDFGAWLYDDPCPVPVDD